MGKYDGSHLGLHKTKSQQLIQTACNLLEHCIKVSSDQNEQETVVNELSELDTSFSSIDSPLFINSDRSNSMARAYIVESRTRVVVAFRGSGINSSNTLERITGIAKNAMTDLNVQFIKDLKFPGKVHKGFSSDYLEIREKIIELLENVSSKKTIFVTGFSLGAALATLCAYDIKNTLDRNPHVYLFAQPAAGNHDFTRAFENKISTVFRFAHEKDIIPQIPHGIFCEYKASGKKLFVFNEDAEQVHHDKIKLIIKVKRSSSVKVTYAVLRTFAKFHKPEHYKRKLVNLFLNYNSKTKRNSSMAQGAEKQYQACQKHCIM